MRGAAADPWPVRIGPLTLECRAAVGGQVGVFPEHAATWGWLDGAVRQAAAALGRAPVVLSLFAYTGGASLACAAAGARVTHVDLDEGLVDVDGKTGRRRVAIGDTTVRALDRYVRARARRADSGEPWLWLGRKRRLRETGLAKLVRDRCEAAGLAGVHPHLFRHAYAQSMLSAGMQETDLMEVAGWRSREMVARYAKSMRAERARKVARSLSPADRLAQDGRR